MADTERNNPLGPAKTPETGEKTQPEPKDKGIEKVVTGTAKRKKKSIGEKIKGVFFSGDFEVTAKYVVGDVIIPAIKMVIVDAITKGAERAVWGVARTKPMGAQGPRYSYHTPLNQPQRGYLPDQPLPLGNRGVQSSGSSDVVLPTREEAELVLDRLNTVIDQYEVASVADMLGLCGLPSNYVDRTWGWFSIAGATIHQVREGVLLDLPPAQAL